MGGGGVKEGLSCRATSGGTFFAASPTEIYIHIPMKKKLSIRKKERKYIPFLLPALLMVFILAGNSGYVAHL